MKRRVFLSSVLAQSSFGRSSRRIAPGIEFIAGAVNGVRLGPGGRTAVYGDPRRGAAPAERVLLTHNRRDVCWVARSLAARGAEIFAPAAEIEGLGRAESFWESFETARYHDYAQQSSRVATQSFTNLKAVAGGWRLAAGGVSIEALATPGVTRGAVSYLIESGGRRAAATGDLIYGPGQLLDLYSLQDAIEETKTRGYHGYAARAADLIASLERVSAWRPEVLLPARGPAIEDPREAIARLIGRIREVFREYFAVDALRWYWGDANLRARARRVLGQSAPEWMPMAETREKLPDWLAAIQNTRVIRSRTGARFLLDCGSHRIFEQVRAQGGGKVEGLWISHYHDDHTDYAQAAAEELGCPVYACAEMKDILENPAAYRMPAETANPIRIVRPTRHGEKLRWHEFEFTFLYFPGQTLYHGGLHVRPDAGEEAFFIGDSFTPSGLDDYCLLNRNILRRGEGYLECLRVVRDEYPKAWLVNQHVPPLFRFSRAQLDFMQANLERRMRGFSELFPWPDLNYGLDEQWARIHPYGLTLRRGETARARVVIRNHSPRREEYRVSVHAPRGWTVWAAAPRVAIEAGREGGIALAVTAPAAGAGRAVLTADVAFGVWELREWCEALVSIRP